MNNTEKKIYDNLSLIKKMISENDTKANICRFLNVKPSTLEKYLKKYNLNYSGNPSRKGLPHYEQRTSYKEYTENGKSISSSQLRLKLIEQGVKESKCEICHLHKWMGKNIPLELHHIDNNHYNNKLENLMILCPNCHMLIHDYNNKIKEPKKLNLKNKETNINQICKFCSEKFNGRKQQKYCSIECKNQSSQKNIPKKEILLEKINELKSYVQVGKFYSVSDNTIRKWCEKYQINLTCGTENMKIKKGVISDSF